ncbi:MAG TPA: arginine repressor [Actinomycetota bacterium]|nr:arginine repressor [Actinomycetota bacterium]
MANERSRRRAVLMDLLEAGFAGTQDEIVKRMARKGFTVTQATVSRDLEDLGAVRQRVKDKVVYALPVRNGPPTGFGSRVLSELVRTAKSSGNLVVVKTFPGMAATVAAVVDSADVEGAMGTVAGDDTVLVIADEKTSGRTLASRITKLAAR